MPIAIPTAGITLRRSVVVQATNNLSDERAEFLINDRLSFMRFLGLGVDAGVILPRSAV